MKDHESKLEEFRGRQIVAEARRSAARKKLESEAKKGASDDTLAALAREALASDDLIAPTAHRYLVNDATLEKLGELLKENPNGLTQFRDELSGWLRSMDRQGHESDKGFYLESWNGSGSYTWDRIGRGTIFIPNVCLSVFGTIQPGPLSRYLRGSISGEEADGFIPRFQVLLYPDIVERYVHVDRYPSVEAKSEAYAVFKAINQLDPVSRGCQVDQERGIPYVNFCHEAQDYFDAWWIGLENRVRSGTLSNVMASHLSKYRSLLPSMAEIFHLIDVCVWPDLPPVSLHATEAAKAWCDLLEAHARRIYQAGMDGDPEDAIKLGDRIKESLPNPFTYRQVAQKGWTNLSTVEEVKRAVGILEDRSWVKVVEVATTDRGGRPSEQVYIHPRLMAEDAGSKI
ncbi:MAG: DUF3987 domain-containing protein [Isosphaerales bacterium]